MRDLLTVALLLGCGALFVGLGYLWGQRSRITQYDAVPSYEEWLRAEFVRITMQSQPLSEADWQRLREIRQHMRRQNP